MTWNIPISETELAKVVSESLRTRLPESWRVELTEQPTLRGSERFRPDAIVDLQAPDGRRARLVAEFKTTLEAKDVRRVLDQLGRYPEATPLVVAPYLGQRTREVLAGMGAAFLDSTGNIRIAISEPAVFIESAGAHSNPWRERRPLMSLKGPAAGRVVRALSDFVPPYGVRELSARSSTPVATVARVIDVLDREALIERERRGPVTRVDWEGVLRRWTSDYSFSGTNRTAAYLEPRGVSALAKKLGQWRERYAITSSLAAAQLNSVAPPRLVSLFVPSIPAAAERLELTPAEIGTNVILAEPYDSVVYERTWSRDGLTFTGLSQVAADLLTGPGRAPAEAEELMSWMKANENEWRARA